MAVVQTLHKFTPSSIVLKFLCPSAKYAASITLGCLCALGHGATFPILAIMIGDQIGLQIHADQQKSAGANSTYTRDLSSHLLNGLVLTVIQVMFCFGERLLPLLPALYMVHKLEDKLVKNVLRLPLDEIRRKKTGEINSLLHDNMQEIGEGAPSVTYIIATLSVALIGYGFAFFLNWKLAAIMFYLVPGFAILTKFSKTYFTKFRSVEHKCFMKANGIVSECLSSIKTVLCFNAQEVFLRRFQKEVASGAKAYYKRCVVYAATFSAQLLLVYSAYAWCFWCGSRLIGNDYQERGRIYALLLIVISSAKKLNDLDTHFKKLHSATASYQAVQPIIKDHKQKSKISIHGNTSRINGNVTFKNVCFAYESQKDVKVLDNINLEIKSGEHIAIVGQNGAGKSTLAAILLELFKPTSGQILFDNRPASTFNLHTLRQQLGYVAQEPTLFDNSIKYNIAAGKEGASDQEILQAAEAANVHLFANNFKNNLDTLVGPGGSSLSGGQRQRVAIARALLRDPKIMIFDEATSALDTHNEKEVLDAINKSCSNCTTLTVTHRMHIALTADEVIVLERGRIVEQGAPQLLIEERGKFFEMLQQEQLECPPEIEDEIDEESRARTLSFNSEVVRKKSSSQFRARSISISSLKNAMFGAKSKNKLSAFLILIKPNDSATYLNIAISLLLCLLEAANFALDALLVATALNNLRLESRLMREQMTMTFIYLMALALSKGVVHFWKGVFMAKFASKTSYAIRNHLFRAILGNKFMNYFERPQSSSGILSKRLNTDIANVDKIMGEQMLNMFSSTISALICWIISFCINPSYAACCFVLFPIKQLLYIIKIRVNLHFHSVLKPIEERVATFLTDVLSNMETVYAFSLQRQAFENYQNLMEDVRKYNELCYCHSRSTISRRTKYKAYVEAILYGLQSAMDFVFFIVGFAIGSIFVQNHGMSAYHMWLIYFLNLKANQKMVDLTSSISELSSAYYSIKTLLETYRTADQHDVVHKRPHSAKQISEGHVLFNEVCFHYESRPHMETLTKIKLDLRKGQTIALVGRSGMGKSTIASLTQRLYDCTSGKITIDGHEIAELDLEYLRAKVAMVPQQPTLFDCTIADNIKVGLDATQESVEQAAAQANAHELIMSLPHGYGTVVGVNGVQLSGGQRQRIAIARALVREPSVLILDEPSSALDYHNEKAVQVALSRVQHNFACLLITHRLESARKADEIIVLHKGRILERGTHEELIDKHAYYWKLHNAGQDRK